MKIIRKRVVILRNGTYGSDSDDYKSFVDIIKRELQKVNEKTKAEGMGLHYEVDVVTSDDDLLAMISGGRVNIVITISVDKIEVGNKIAADYPHIRVVNLPGIPKKGLALTVPKDLVYEDGSLERILRFCY